MQYSDKSITFSQLNHLEEHRHCSLPTCTVIAPLHAHMLIVIVNNECGARLLINLVYWTAPLKETVCEVSIFLPARDRHTSDSTVVEFSVAKPHLNVHVFLQKKFANTSRTRWGEARCCQCAFVCIATLARSPTIRLNPSLIRTNFPKSIIWRSGIQTVMNRKVGPLATFTHAPKNFCCIWVPALFTKQSATLSILPAWAHCKAPVWITAILMQIAFHFRVAEGPYYRKCGSTSIDYNPSMPLDIS